MKRKLLCVLLAVMMFVTMVTPALAVDSERIDVQQAIARGDIMPHPALDSMDALRARALARDTNDERNRTQFREFETILELESRSRSAVALSELELEMVTQYRVLATERVENLSKLSDEALFALGYDAGQIYVVRNFAGTDEHFMALSATANVWLDIDWHRPFNNGRDTETRLFFQFRWTAQPFWGFRDFMTLTWNDWLVRGHASSVMYVDSIGNLQPRWQTPTFLAGNAANAGASWRYNKNIEDNRFWAREGTVSVVLETSRRTHIAARGEVVHNRFGLSVNPPTFTLPGGAAASISVGFLATRTGVNAQRMPNW